MKAASARVPSKDLSVHISLGSKACFFSKCLPANLLGEIKNYLTIQNPKWTLNEKYGRYNEEKQYIAYYVESNGVFTFPRGFMPMFLRYLGKHGVPYEIQDSSIRIPIDVAFKGQLRPYQADAVKAIVSRRYGLFEAPTGGGKTVIACSVISVRKQKTLVVVHSKELLHQWKDRIMNFLTVEEKDVGLIGDGHFVIGDKITVGIINSLANHVGKLSKTFGQVIVDECHRTPARTFTHVLSKLNSFFVLGLSATPYRVDPNSTKVIYYFVGDRVHSIKPEQLLEVNGIARARLEVHPTNFDFHLKSTSLYQEMITELVNDYHRNQLILHHVIESSKKSDGVSLVISDRVAHCEQLHTMLQELNVRSGVLTGQMGKKERGAVHEQISKGGIKILIASSKLIVEGFDLPALDQLHIVIPMRYHGRVVQAIGRILRAKEGKKAVVHDYVDVNIGVLKHSFKNRLYAYRHMGVEIGRLPFA
jgi:superfamily II DNA or RNA helicase